MSCGKEFETMVEEYRKDVATSGKFPFVAWPGCYPLVYVTNDSSSICAKCVNDAEKAYDIHAEYNGENVVACDVNWEDTNLWCDDCSTRIESAHMEDDV